MSTLGKMLAEAILEAQKREREQAERARRPDLRPTQPQPKELQ
jgi:hypothetical protein